MNRIPGYDLPPEDSPTPQIPNKPGCKPGYKTSEFWMTAMVTIISLLNQSGLLGSIVMPPETLAAVIMPIMTYIISRHKTKK